MSLSDIYQDGCLTVDSAQLLTVAKPAAEGMHVRVSPFGDIAWRGAVNDFAYLNGVRIPLAPPVFGNYPLCFDHRDGSLIVQHTNGGHPEILWATRYGRDGVAIGGDVSMTVSPQGIDRIEPDGRVITYDDPSFIRTMPNGEVWAGCQETANFIVGGYGPPGDDRFNAALSKLDKRTGQVTRWLGRTQVPHRCVEVSGQLYTFISGIAQPPAPDQVVWVEAFPPPIPVTKPPLQPLPDGEFPSCWIGIQSDYGRGPGNCTWSPSPDPTDTRPVTETSAGAGTIVGRAYLHGLCLTDQNNPPQTVEAEILFTQAKGGTALYIHQDDQSQTQRENAANMLLRVQTANLHPLHALHVTGAFTPASGFNALTMNLRTVGVDLPQLATNWAWFVGQLKLGLIEVGYLTNVFERDPIHDLSTCWPELYAQVIELLGRIPTPRLKPGEVLPPPVEPPVTPPPVVNPRPPRPPKPPHPEKPNYFGAWKKGL